MKLGTFGKISVGTRGFPVKEAESRAIRRRMWIRCATGVEGEEKPGTFGKNESCFRFGPMKAGGAGPPGPLRVWVRFVIDRKNPGPPLSDIQLSNSSGRRTPTRIADGHADSHDEYDMGACRYLRKLLKNQGKIVVTVKSAAAGGAQMQHFRENSKVRTGEIRGLCTSIELASREQ